jgi:hypothetical protein
MKNIIDAIQDHVNIIDSQLNYLYKKRNDIEILENDPEINEKLQQSLIKTKEEMKIRDIWYELRCIQYAMSQIIQLCKEGDVSVNEDEKDRQIRNQKKYFYTTALFTHLRILTDIKYINTNTATKIARSITNRIVMHSWTGTLWKRRFDKIDIETIWNREKLSNQAEDIRIDFSGEYANKKEELFFWQDEEIGNGKWCVNIYQDKEYSGKFYLCKDILYPILQQIEVKLKKR